MNHQLSEGTTAPEFTLMNQDGKDVSLADYRNQKVIVYFYPAAMTPGCTTQAVDFAGAMADLQNKGYTVLGISPDPVAKLEKFMSQAKLNFTLLSDPQRKVLQAYGAYGTKKLYGKEIQGVIRSTFIVDVDPTGKGTVVQAMYNVRAKGHVDKLRRELGL